MSGQRKSYSELGKIYFFTATIHKWRRLLHSDEHKKLIIDYLHNLSEKGLLKVYGFVIMPNHMHIIWQQLKKNGKETPQASVLKHTAHVFLKKLKITGESRFYETNKSNKKHEIWRRDSLSVELYSKAFARQKLEYIHANPISGIWKLSKDDLDYYYSSARFYEFGKDDFGFLNDLFAIFDGD